MTDNPQTTAGEALNVTYWHYGSCGWAQPSVGPPDECEMCGEEDMALEECSDASEPVTTDLPPRFRLLLPGGHVGGDGFVLINENSLTEHSSRWHSASEARMAAWDWWHDVKEKSDV